MCNQHKKPVRKHLSATRKSITHKFTIDGHEGYITAGLFDDGQPGEVFIKMAKEGSTVGGLMDTIGVLTSLALQYGVSLEKLVAKFERTSFQPAGFTKHAEIGPASSIVDYIFRWLGVTFSDQDSCSTKGVDS